MSTINQKLGARENFAEGEIHAWRESESIYRVETVRLTYPIYIHVAEIDQWFGRDIITPRGERLVLMDEILRVTKEYRPDPIPEDKPIIWLPGRDLLLICHKGVIGLLG